jgi:hypothetical protein
MKFREVYELSATPSNRSVIKFVIKVFLIKKHKSRLCTNISSSKNFFQTSAGHVKAKICKLI